MFSEIHLQNFKCFHEVSVPLKKVNVFIGQNGDGKSSVIQALGLLKQSIGHDRLIFDGPIVYLDGFEQVLHNHLGIVQDMVAIVFQFKLTQPNLGSVLAELRGITDIDFEIYAEPFRTVTAGQVASNSPINFKLEREGDTKFRITENIMVGEAFGSNQLVMLLYVLAEASQGATVAIEEPEIHLHPSAQAKLVKVLLEQAKQKDLQLIIATHSPYLLTGMGLAVKNGVLQADQLSIQEFRLNKEGVASVCSVPFDRDTGVYTREIEGFFDADLEGQEFLRQMQMWNETEKHPK